MQNQPVVETEFAPATGSSISSTENLNTPEKQESDVISEPLAEPDVDPEVAVAEKKLEIMNRLTSGEKLREDIMLRLASSFQDEKLIKTAIYDLEAEGKITSGIDGYLDLVDFTREEIAEKITSYFANNPEPVSVYTVDSECQLGNIPGYLRSSVLDELVDKGILRTEGGYLNQEMRYAAVERDYERTIDAISVDSDIISRGRVRFTAKFTPDENGVFCTTLGNLFNSEELYATHRNGLADTPVLFDDLNGVDSHGIHLSKSFITVFNITSGSLFGDERTTYQNAILKDRAGENIKHFLPGYISDVLAGRDTTSGSPAINSPVFEATDRFMTMNLNDIRQELNGYDLNLRASIETDDKGRRSVAMEDLLGADGLFSELYDGRRKFAEVPVIFGPHMEGDTINTIRPRSDWITNTGRIANTKGKPEALKEFVIDRIMDMVTNARVHYDHLAIGNEPELEHQTNSNIIPVFNYDVELVSSRDTNVLDVVKLNYNYAGISIKTNLTISEEKINRSGSVQALSDDIANETFSRLASYAERELGANLSRTENVALGASFTLNGEEYTLGDLAKTIEPALESLLTAVIPDRVQEQISQESQETEKQQPDSLSSANNWSRIAKDWGLDASLELPNEEENVQQRVLDYIKEEGPRSINSILSVLADDNTVTKTDLISAVEALVNYDELVQMPSSYGSMTLELRERFEEKLVTILRNLDSPVALKDIQEQSGGFSADLERRLRRMSSEGAITWNSQDNTFSVPASGKAMTEELGQNIERQSTETRVAVALSRLELADRTLDELSRAERARFDVIYDALENGGRYNRKPGDNNAVSSCWRSGLLAEHDGEFYLTKNEAEANAEVERQVLDYVREEPEGSTSENIIFVLAGDYAPAKNVLNTAIKSLIAKGELLQTDALPNGEIFFDVRDRVEERRLNVVQEQTQIDTEQADHASGATTATSEEKEQLTASLKAQRKENYHITDDALGSGGQKTKYARNVAAIRTLKQIESEDRLATPDEQETLAQYVGWGGLSQAFDKDNSSWAREYAELKELLTDDEYKSARGSTLNAHYTSPTVIKAIYETVERMGFTTGNILEPSCGTGNFFGLLPESMKDSKLYGVELDNLTGRIAKQLYQNADITISGFEKTKFQDNTFDIAIGNVPFGNYGVTDSKYDKNNFLIHDYFFAKALDQVRPGGVVALITSKGTMDKQNEFVRDYMAQRSELLGAVRLPNNAFKANAGTEVTTDILFLQKRQQPVLSAKAEWVEVSPDKNGVPVNNYFQNHPEMMLGTMAFDSSMYGGENETTCNPIEGTDLAEQLRTALSNIQGRIERWEQEIPSDQEKDRENKERKSIPALPGVRNYSFTVVEDKLYYREGSLMHEPANMSQKAAERAKAMVKLRDLCRTVIEDQFAGTSDENLRVSQEKLNKAYDDFVTRYGRINDSANKKAFNKDSSYYLLCSLEVLDEKRNFERKADIFTKRTIRPNTIPTHADSAQDALTLSMSERARVDLDYMSNLTGFDKPKLLSELQGAIFRVPDIVEPYTQAPVYQTADEYLSGNVLKKLETARIYAESQPELYSANVSALEQVQPRKIEAADIDIRLGSTWVDASIVKDFMCSLLETPSNDYHNVEYSPISAAWNVTNKKHAYGNVLALSTYGTAKMNAYELIEDTLNLKQARVTKTVSRADGGESQVTDYKETSLAQQKQALIKRKFREWVFQDPDRRKYLVDKYNVQFNSTRTREYNGEHLRFGGINPGIELMPHQKNAIARVLYGGNTLLAHEVGAGKTFEMVASAMESKRLGLASKSLFVVPNHLTEQTATEMLRLYPGANVLVTTQEDFKKENRQNFCARIATGGYDAIIIGHSQFEKIPLSLERQQAFLQTQIDTIADAIEEMRDAGSSRWSIKQMEATRKRLEGRLDKLANPSAESKQKDDVVTFEELGCDRLFVDEAHNYKNLYTITKMGNVAGISHSESQKAMDMFLKCCYMDELTAGKGIIFATGTPVSNSITELYTMQRYLQYSTLQEMGLEHFDKWASTFGEATTSLELAPEGTGFRMKTRFAKFGNIPELMKMFKEIADIKTAESLDLPRPEVEYHTISVPATEEQKKLITNLSDRAYKVHNRQVTPEQDNMLKITSDGRKIGLDQRLWNPLIPDDPGSKVNACVKNVLRIWKDTEEDRSTQIIFCDFSTPDKSKFNVYHDIKAKLIKNGVPEEEIAFIHDAKTDEAKDKLFAKVKSGAVRVLIGSTQKMGVGTNVQDRLIATHDLDCPWRPADMEQRAGRIVRRGNTNEKVDIYRYVTEGTFDAYLFQTLENKQKFISQVMTEKTVSRTCDDVDESVLSYSEIKALCIGDPRIKERMELDIQIKQLEMLRGSYVNEHYALQDKLRSYYPKRMENTQKEIEALEKDLQQAEATKEAEFSMKILGTTYTDKKEAGEALLTVAQTLGMNEGSVIGEYRGFSMSLDYNMLSGKILLVLSGETAHEVELGESATGNLTRIEHAFGNIGGRLEDERNNIVDIQKQIQSARKELERPFEQEEELNAKHERLAVLNGELAMDDEKAETMKHASEESEENSNDLEVDSKENSELDSTLDSIVEAELVERALKDLEEDAQKIGQEMESEEHAQAPVPEKEPQLHDIVQFTPKDPTLMPRQGELISIDGDIARLRFKHGLTMATFGVRWSTGTLQVVEAASQKSSNSNTVTEPLRNQNLEKSVDRSNGNKRGGRGD